MVVAARDEARQRRLKPAWSGQPGAADAEAENPATLPAEGAFGPKETKGRSRVS